MRVGLVNTPIISPSYMRREYVKNFGKFVLILFDYIMVHGRVFKEVHPWFERYVMSLGREIIAYQFVEHEVGRIVILNFSSMNEHSKFDAPCRYSFQFITYMASQGSKRFFPWDERFGRFQWNEGINGNLFNVSYTWFCLIICAYKYMEMPQL